MSNCPTCEYHKKRAQLWRDEVYRLTGHPLPRKENMIEDDDDIQDYKKPWVGLTYEDQEEIVLSAHSIRDAINKTDQKLKEKNT